MDTKSYKTATSLSVREIDGTSAAVKRIPVENACSMLRKVFTMNWTSHLSAWNILLPLRTSLDRCYKHVPLGSGATCIVVVPLIAIIINPDRRYELLLCFARPIQATTSPIFHRWFTLMHLPHSLTVSDIRPPRVIYDFLSSNETILLGILRGRLRNPVEIIYTANRVIFSGWKSFPIPNDVMDVICFYIFYGVYYFYVTKEMILLFD